MDKKPTAREYRERAAKLRLGTPLPRCATCGFDDWPCLEAHHIAGQPYDPLTNIECRNCHRRLSDSQKDHPGQMGKPPTAEESLMHFLLGLADLFELLVKKLREFAGQIMEKLGSVAEDES
jgi:hypothetical protein